MTAHIQNAEGKAEQGADGARAILRVPEVLIAVASEQGLSFAQLRDHLGLPKSSLHRLLRTLEQGGYLVERSGAYSLGPSSARLSQSLADALPARDLQSSVRPTLEWMAQESGESVMLAVLTDDREMVAYVDVINSSTPLRVTVPLGQKRPLYAAASGQAILAFLSPEERDRYLMRTDFEQLTPDTLDRDGLSEKLIDVHERGVVFDRNGSFIGASGIASPCFDRSNRVCGAVSVAGPTDRLDPIRERLCQLSLEAGERVSRLLGFTGTYPPRP